MSCGKRIGAGDLVRWMSMMRQLLRRYWPLAFGLVSCGLALHQFDWASIATILPSVPVGWLLVLMAVLTTLVFVTCACRWVAISQLPWSLTVFPRVYCYTAFVIGASIVTPLQMGELLKVRFAQESGLKIGNSAMNVALERILDLATIAGMGLAGLVFVQTGSSFLSLGAMLIVFAAGMGTPTVLFVVVGRLGESPFATRMRSVAGEGLSASRLAALGVTTALKWALTLLAWILILEAVNVDLPIPHAALLVGSVTAISILSMIPGGIGIQELSVRAILLELGVDPANAEAAAIVLRLFTVVMIALGLAHLPFLYKKSNSSGGKETHV